MGRKQRLKLLTGPSSQWASECQSCTRPPGSRTDLWPWLHSGPQGWKAGRGDWPGLDTAWGGVYSQAKQGPVHRVAGCPFLVSGSITLGEGDVGDVGS